MTTEERQKSVRELADRLARISYKRSGRDGGVASRQVLAAIDAIVYYVEDRLADHKTPMTVKKQRFLEG